MFQTRCSAVCRRDPECSALDLTESVPEITIMVDVSAKKKGMKVLFVVSRRRDENWWGKSSKGLMKEVATQRGENSSRWQWEETV